MTGRLQSLVLALVATCSSIVVAACGSDGDGVGSGNGSTTNPPNGTSSGSGAVEQCKVTLTADDPSTETGKSLGVTARLDARVSNGGTTRDIVNETAVTEFEWTPTAPLEEVPNAAVGTKKSFTSKTAGSFGLKVTSKISPTCSANVDLTFTGEAVVVDPFPAGTFTNLTFFALIGRSDGKRNGCDPADAMTLTIEKTGEGTARAKLTGTSTCGIDSLTCTDRIADLDTTASGPTMTTPISGGCTLEGMDDVAADASYSVRYEPASQFYPKRWVVRMEPPGATYRELELAFPLP